MGSIVITLRGADRSAIAGLTFIACAIGAGGIALAQYFVGPPLLAAAFALLAAASAFTLDESASAVVDVTPTGPAAQTAARAVALAAPVCGGLGLLVGMALRPTTVPMWAMVLALIGNVLLGFAVAGVGRVQTGEPGLWASAATAFPLVLAPLYEPVNRRIHTFPSTRSEAISSSTWWAIAATISLLIIAIAARTDRAFR
jgi:hypothetical protein